MRLSLRDHRNVALIDKKEFRDVWLSHQRVILPASGEWRLGLLLCTLYAQNGSTPRVSRPQSPALAEARVLLHAVLRPSGPLGQWAGTQSPSFTDEETETQAGWGVGLSTGLLPPGQRLSE